MLPIFLACGCVNQTLPSGPSTIIAGRLFRRQDRKFLDVARPGHARDAIRLVLPRTTDCRRCHRRIPAGPAPLGNSISVKVPVVLSRPMRLPECSVNQRLPSVPAVIPAGPLSSERQRDVRDFSVRCDAPNPVADRIGEPHQAWAPRLFARRIRRDRSESAWSRRTATCAQCRRPGAR